LAAESLLPKPLPFLFVMKQELEQLRQEFNERIDALLKPKLTIDEIASKLIGLSLEDTKSELIRMKSQIIETLNNL
jgi:hypothetical protein